MRGCGLQTPASRPQAHRVWTQFLTNIDGPKHWSWSPRVRIGFKVLWHSDYETRARGFWPKIPRIGPRLEVFRPQVAQATLKHLTTCDRTKVFGLGGPELKQGSRCSALEVQNGSRIQRFQASSSSSNSKPKIGPRFEVFGPGGSEDQASSNSSNRRGPELD